MSYRLLALLSLGATLSALAAATASGAGARPAHEEQSAISRAPVARGLVAPRGVCRVQDRAGAPAAVQERAMLCLIDFARRASGLPSLDRVPDLASSAAHKSRDMLRCNAFSHEACGREYSHWIRASGYMSVPCWRIGENIAWGRGRSGSARSIFIALIHSASHRRNILGRFTEVGIDTRTGNLSPLGRVQVWTQDFGSQC